MVSTISSTAKSSLRQLQTFNSDDNKNHLRYAIFSPPLNSKEGTLVGKHGETSQKFSRFISSRKVPLHQGENKEEDGEIGVFGAEKYFNEGEVEASGAANIAATKYLHQRDHQIALEARQYEVQYGTPSVRSESTCNSQSALLHSAMRNSQRNKNKKAQAKMFLASLGIKCSCSDKNSVDTSDHAGEISFNKTAIYDVYHGKTIPKKVFDVGLDANHSVKISKPHAELLINNDVHFPKPEKFAVGLNKENSLAFSAANSGLGNHLVKMQLQLEEEEEEEPRKSLAVFGSPILSHKSKSLSFDKKLTIPSRDDALKMEEIDLTANSGSNYNDAASDASSDLFEIESIKGKSNPFLARQASDAASGCVSPTTCYAPSEASIEWSVVTASAAVPSDCEEQMSEVTIRSPIRTSFAPSNGKTRDSRESHRRRPGMLLGCKSHKAVRVAGDAFITYEKLSSNSPQTRHRNNTSQVARFPSESKLGNFGARHGQHAYSTPPPMQRSHSPHASQLLHK